MKALAKWKMALHQRSMAAKSLFLRGGRLLRREVPYSWSAGLYQGLAILACEYMLLYTPPPGFSVTILAVSTIVMTFRITSPNFGRPERVLWILLSGVFLCVELLAISTDRNSTANRELRDRADDRTRFQAIVDQGSQINRKQNEDEDEQRKKFKALLGQEERVIKDLGNVASSVTEATSYGSGGSSFPVVFPGEVTLDDGTQRIGFYTTKQGKFPLYDLKMSVGRPYINDGPNRSLIIYGAQCKYAELNGDWSIPALAVSIGNENSAYFTASFWARNGAWDEVIDVRRVGGKLVSRWVLYQANTSPLKVVLDLADARFPAEHRHDSIYPFASLLVPEKRQRQTSLPDVPFRPSECEIKESYFATITIGGK